jgi:transcription elongation GreA/GreB family factor
MLHLTLLGRLSVKAPVAAAILGKKEGDIFEVILPRVKRKYKLIKLEYK